MENHNNDEMMQIITEKLGFDIRTYNSSNFTDAHENDNIPNPFDKLTLEELLFLRDNHYFVNT